eukprot:8871880-Alexandrium_andersonii.AAC.1
MLWDEATWALVANFGARALVVRLISLWEIYMGDRGHAGTDLSGTRNTAHRKLARASKQCRHAKA